MENMENNFYQQGLSQEQKARGEQGLDQAKGFAGLSLSRYMVKTFLMMFLGLLVTFATAFFFSGTDMGVTLLLYGLMYIPYFHIVLLVAQLVVVIAMSAMIHKLSPAAATACFIIYSVLTGVTFTFYFLLFDLASLILVFAATALYFGGMAVFGAVTKIDLSRMRTILVGGLIFLIIFNVLMMFIPGLAVADRVMCTVGVIIFLGFTAYDTQKIKTFYNAFQGDEAMLKKASVISALELYLDFINLFLYLLRIFGKKKN